MAASGRPPCIKIFDLALSRRRERERKNLFTYTSHRGEVFCTLAHTWNESHPFNFAVFSSFIFHPRVSSPVAVIISVFRLSLSLSLYPLSSNPRRDPRTPTFLLIMRHLSFALSSRSSIRETTRNVEKDRVVLDRISLDFSLRKC